MQVKVYCAHSQVVPYGVGGYLDCPTCNHGWYSQDPAPFVIIGYTSEAEIDRYPFYEQVRRNRQQD